MLFEFRVTVEITHESGKFATKDDLADSLIEQIEGCDPDLSSEGPDGDSVYTIDDFSIERI